MAALILLLLNLNSRASKSCFFAIIKKIDELYVIGRQQEVGRMIWELSFSCYQTDYCVKFQLSYSHDNSA